MKLFLMKLCSLLVLLQGCLLLAWFLNLAPLTEPLRNLYSQALVASPVPPLTLQILLAAAFAVIGLVAFLPRFSGGSMRRAVIIPTEHGNVAVQLEALRPALLKVLRKMPEIRKVRLRLKPTKGRGKVHIVAHIQLKQQASLDVRQHVDIVAAHIADSTVRLLGLENMAEVEVVVDGINVNAKAAAKAVQEEAQSFRAHLASHAKTEELALAAATAAAALDSVAVAAHADDTATPFARLDEGREAAPAPAEPEPYVEWKDEDEAEDAVATPLDTPATQSENLEPLADMDLPEASTEATINREDGDVSYSFPPLSEQEEDEAESLDETEDFNVDELAEQHKFNSGTDIIGENDIEEEREEEEEDAILSGSAPQVDDLAPSPFNDATEEKTVDDEPGAFAAVFDEEDETAEAEARVGDAHGDGDGPEGGPTEKKRWSFF